MPNSPRTAAARRRMAAERARLNLLRLIDPNGSMTGTLRRARQAAAVRRHNAARIIQARVRGMLTRGHLANPNWGREKRTYANVVAGRPGRPGLGYKAVAAMLARSPNTRATGARIRTGIRYGPEHYVSGRLRPRWSTNASRCIGGLCTLERMPRGYSTRTRSPPRRRSPGRNNNNNLYH
jgi:hypothetical protein